MGRSDAELKKVGGGLSARLLPRNQLHSMLMCRWVEVFCLRMGGFLFADGRFLGGLFGDLSV
jgi:hypothetical protein